MTIEEGNNIIAEFMPNMEWYIPKNQLYSPYWKRFDEDGLIRKEIYPQHLLYHKSWDELMPVVEKIEDMRGYVTLHDHEIGFYHSGILELGLCVFSWEKNGRHFNPKILHVWEGVIAFIQWYNKHKEYDNQTSGIQESKRDEAQGS